MSSSLVITLAVIGGVAWLAFLGVSALRTRGKEQVPQNLAPGRSDEELETNRLERFQQVAVLISGFMAVSLPLYFLGETDRQESFVDQFHEESVTRGEHLVTEFACFSCHGAGGAGGSANYIEKRTGVTVSWSAPSLNDVLYRYSPDEVNFWVTYGRPNTPMPPWGVAGGGAMNEAQVADIVAYLGTIQIPQQEVLGEIQGVINGEMNRLDGADQAMASAITTQSQLVADIQRAPGLADNADALANEMRSALDAAGDGVDTDGDGLSDIAETQISDLTQEFAQLWALPGIEATAFDVANSHSTGRPDREVAEELLATLSGLAADLPILANQVAAIEAALAETGDDQDADGLTDSAEGAISTSLDLAINSVRPAAVIVLALDPTNAESSGQPDLRATTTAVAANEGVALQQVITRDNQERLLATANAGLDALLRAQEERKWEINIEGVASLAFGGDVELAARAVGLFNGYCARCHTSGWSGGVPFTQDAGSGGFGPALWDGRPSVQFLTPEDVVPAILQFLTTKDLVEFITEGSVAQAPYGVNGIGTGRMPGFGQILPTEDLELIATYLRSGNFTGEE
ncbi:MAG TPA: c-type cytochrome [Acidimicrobiia bacterium]|nr:c-type cytochrome [Acidimicrobiia bacterium]